jgi:hypothetical protein
MLRPSSVSTLSIPDFMTFDELFSKKTEGKLVPAIDVS